MKTISNKIAEEILRLFPNDCKIVKIKLLYTDIVRKYVMGIEEVHKRASKSTLKFKGI